MHNSSLSYSALSSVSTLAIGYATNNKGRFSKGCPCPVCGSESSKCKVSKDNQMIVMCMTFHQGDRVPGWRHIKESSSNWALWIEEKHSEDYDREEWRRLSEARQQHRLLETRKVLSEAERSRFWRQVFDQLTLDKKDRDHLRNRGLSDFEIEEGGFVSAQAEQRLEGYFPKNFSGTWYKSNTKSCHLATHSDGFMAPIWNAKKQIVGAQIYTYKEENKYVWLSYTPKGSKNSLGVLPSNELPLAVHCPVQPCLDMILYTEGTIIKPFIASRRFNAWTIGAAGGLFGQRNLHSILKDIQKEIGSKVFGKIRHVLTPDAAAITNPHVVTGYRKLNESLKALGLQLEIAWWKQYDKTDADVDEIDVDCTSIDYRSFDSFVGESDRLIKRNKLAEERLKNQLYKVDNRSFKPLSQEYLVPYYPGCLSLSTDAQAQCNDQQTITSGDYLLTTPEHQLAFYEEAERLGYGIVLNRCPPGWGKSFWGGKLAQVLKLGKANDETVLYAYYTQQSRCPSTETVESNFAPLTIRHTGMIADRHRKTALGQPFYRILKASDPRSAEIVVESNCQHSQMFAVLAAKGHDYRNVNGDENPICQNCTMVDECKASGYRYQRKRDLGSNDDGTQAQEVAIRLHPASASNWMDGYEFTIPNSKKKGFIPGFSKVIAIWEEAETLLAPVIQTITRDELDFCWRHLERSKLAIHKKLAPFREAIDLMMSNPPTWGYETSDVRAALDAIIAWDEILLTSSEWQQIKKVFEPDISKAMFLGQVNYELLSSSPSSALVDLIGWWKLWTEDSSRTAIRVGERTITLTRPPERMVGLINNQASFNVFLDATMDRNVLAAKLGVDPGEILVCTALEPESNVKRLRVTGFGRNNRDRAESTDTRLKRLKETLPDYLAKRYELQSRVKIVSETTNAVDISDELVVEVADYLNKREEHGAKIGHMSNSRGTNEVAGCDVLIVHGLPTPNMGAIKDEFYTLNTELFSADEYYRYRIASEVTQLDKRNRASRYNGWFYVVYVTTDSLPFEDVEDVTIDEINPDASALKLSHTRILEVGREMVKRGIKLTQTELATRLGVSEIWLKKWLKKENADWKRLKIEIEKTAKTKHK